MCGICGFNWSDQELIARMTKTLQHRGPDQDGLYCDDKISLGHRRLSIIDLSEHGRQPLSNEDGSIQVVYNGEIYNFQGIKDDLIAKGHQFVGGSDTEILVHGYEEYGYELLQKLNGMFAFAIWDKNKERIWIARDRIGIKPLYYSLREGKFSFASEIKAMLEDSALERQVNYQAMYRYLCFEFVPAPETMFAGINKLPAGHYAVYEKGELTVTRYWDLNFAVNPDVSEDAIVENVRDLIDQAVRRRLLSDVPLGAFLSGGLDSSAIVAMMRRHNPGRLRTFTIGYKDKTFSELDYAQIVAEHFETDHQVLMIDDMDEQSIEKSLWHLDEPMTDLSSIPLMFICQQAKQHVTVCLSGEGGDEVFAGYDRFKAARLARHLNIIPRGIRGPVLNTLASMLPDQRQKKGFINMLKRFMEGAALPDEGMHLRWQFFSNPKLEKHLYSSAFRNGVTSFDPFEPLRPYHARSEGQDIINRQIYADMRYMMTDSVLMKVDKMSMASSVEIRVPLLDHTLVEYMGTVQGNLKLRGSQTKYIFRKALEGILPESIVYRGKQGYSLPVKSLLRGGLKPYMERLLHESPIIRECMNPEYVDQLISEHLAMKHNHNHVLWGMMNIAIWHNRFFN
jgi:asparagine synthase (glutamine-hydrolysing)